jgi:hypothetical protein
MKSCRDRLEGKRPVLKQFEGKRVTISRNGGVPYAVVQAERWNPLTAS